MVIEILIFRMKSFWMKTNRLDPILNDGVHHILMHLTWLNHGWLVVSNMNFIFHFRHGMSSFPLTTSIIFQRGRAQPPTSHGYFHILGRIIPTDELIFFQDGYCTTNKMVFIPRFHGHMRSPGHPGDWGRIPDSARCDVTFHGEFSSELQWEFHQGNIGCSF